MFPSSPHLRMPAGRLCPIRNHVMDKKLSRSRFTPQHLDPGHDTRAFVEGRVEVHRDGPLANLGPMEFQWDDAGSDDCFAHCGFDFAVVIRAIPDPNRIVGSGRCWDYCEEPYRLFREIEGRVLVVIFTIGGSVIRLISTRKANRKEVREYEQNARQNWPRQPNGPAFGTGQFSELPDDVWRFRQSFRCP